MKEIQAKGKFLLTSEKKKGKTTRNLGKGKKNVKGVTAKNA